MNKSPQGVASQPDDFGPDLTRQMRYSGSRSQSKEIVNGWPGEAQGRSNLKTATRRPVILEATKKANIF
jgi:hypothetical protein